MACLMAASELLVYTGPDGEARADPGPNEYCFVNRLAMRVIHSDGRLCTIYKGGQGVPSSVGSASALAALDAALPGSGATVRYMRSQTTALVAPRA